MAMSNERVTGYAGQIDWRGIRAFLLINFVPTWTVWLLMMAAGVNFGAMPPWAIWTVAGTMWFPGLAALIVRKWVTKEGFATAGFRFGGWKPYVGIAVATPILFALTYGLSYLIGAAELDLALSGYIAQMSASPLVTPEAAAQLQAAPPAALLIPLLIMTLTLGPILTGVATAGEELGWTGFLLPKLMPLGKWRATLVYGLIWGLWHAPIIYGGYNYPGHPILGILLMCVFTVVLGLAHAGLRLRYDSVWLTTWLHACINTQARGIWAILFVGVNPLLGGLGGVSGLVVMGLFGLWLLARAPERTY